MFLHQTNLLIPSLSLSPPVASKNFAANSERFPLLITHEFEGGIREYDIY